MNIRLVSRVLGTVCLLIGGFMVFSLPWAHPSLGVRNELSIPTNGEFETRGFVALVGSMVVCLLIGMALRLYGRRAQGRMFRKEAMAVVGLSWVMATVLGGLPFYFSQCGRGPCVRYDHHSHQASLLNEFWDPLHTWVISEPLQPAEEHVIRTLKEAGYRGLAVDSLTAEQADFVAIVESLAGTSAYWRNSLVLPSDEIGGRTNRIGVRYSHMTFVDSLFESQSGFSTTGATVISELEDPEFVPHCILFWRSSAHFLGGLGIIVLFVVVLGQGSVGKALMLAELPGPQQTSTQARMQHVAWSFAAIYCALNLFLTLILMGFGMTMFDALCHAFGTMATGGFSTYNASLGHFDSPGIETVVIIFMILAGSNFTLIFFAVRGQFKQVFADIEWRTYLAIIAVSTALIVLFGGEFEHWRAALRYGLFQVTSIMTTTGFGTHDFDTWSHFAKCILLLLMFVGGCAGSTGGGLKVIRHVLLGKILRLEMEQAFHPNVVRPLRLGGEPVENPELRKTILVYFALITIIFCTAWMAILFFEPDTTWGPRSDNKLIDTASAVAATLNNIGPGVGTVGATQNYGHFGPLSKLLFTWLMMLGRVEVVVILCLFSRRFWSLN